MNTLLGEYFLLHRGQLTTCTSLSFFSFQRRCTWRSSSFHTPVYKHAQQLEIIRLLSPSYNEVLLCTIRQTSWTKCYHHQPIICRWQRSKDLLLAWQFQKTLHCKVHGKASSYFMQQVVTDSSTTWNQISLMPRPCNVCCLWYKIHVEYVQMFLNKARYVRI